MDVDALVREADVLRAKAARLLRDARVVERLGEYGAVSVGGS